MASEGQETAGIIPIPPPLVYAAPLVLGLAVRRALPGVPLPGPLRRGLGALLLGGGAGLCAWFFRAMREAETPVDPRRPVRTLVTSGPFQWTRNPGYLGMAAIYSGVALLANALPALLLLPGVLAAITKGVIEREERYLEGRFGEPYRAYTARVRRWI